MFKTMIYGGVEYCDYGIDELGNVMNRKNNHIYKLSKAVSGYLMVYLPMGKRGKVKAIRVHKAVAETFIPNPNGLPFVNHIDENKANPCVWNLEWVDAKENTNSHWRNESGKGERFNNRKLTHEQAEKLREDSKTMGSVALGKKYGVSRITVWNIVNGKHYANGF